MSFSWEKLGQVFSVEGLSDWMHSHIQNPCPIELEDRVRVFFNTRPKTKNGMMVSYPAYIDLDKRNLKNVIGVAEQPVLDLGCIGCFDEFGCMTSSVIKRKNELWMYYVGWQRMYSVPYNWAIGLAVSQDNGVSFNKLYRGPIIGSYKDEAYLQNGCYVLNNDKTNLYNMFYSSGVAWYEENGKMESQYIIKFASSTNGIDWFRNGIEVIPRLYKEETQTTPFVFKNKDKYHMIFSTRHSVNFRNIERGYRLGYAVSSDLISWQRCDEKLNFGLSDSGWDSEMICYPQALELEGKKYLFYCGNAFGKGGLGIATLIE